MRVPTTTFREDVEGDYGFVDGLSVECDRCGHRVEVLGTTDRSAARAAAMLREECPRDENNFYEVDP